MHRKKRLSQKELSLEPLSGKLPRETIEREIVELVTNPRNPLLANRFVGTIGRLLHLRPAAAGACIVGLLCSGVIYLLVIAISKIANPGEPIFILSAALASLTAGFAFSVVNILYNITIVSNIKTILSWIVDVDGLMALYRWLLRFFSFPLQGFFSLVISILGTLTVWFIVENTTATLEIGSYFVIFVALFTVGHGAYCALTMPTLANVMRRERLALFWLDPAESPIIKLASWAFNQISLGSAVFGAIAISGFYWIRPWESMSAVLVGGAWLVFDLVTISYCFFYPHYNISLVIKAEKKVQLEQLQEAMSWYRAHLDELTEEDFKNLSELVKLYELVLGARDISINISSLGTYITSLFIPTLSFVGVVIDVTSLLLPLT